MARPQVHRDPRVDACIAKASGFAMPVLERFRAIVHDVVPEVDETIKWGRPPFQHAGALLCSMVAFKPHCGLHVWTAQLLTFNGRPVGFGTNGPFAHLTSKSCRRPGNSGSW
jgi:hypothetical protein